MRFVLLLGLVLVASVVCQTTTTTAPNATTVTTSTPNTTTLTPNVGNTTAAPNASTTSAPTTTAAASNTTSAPTTTAAPTTTVAPTTTAAPTTTPAPPTTTLDPLFATLPRTAIGEFSIDGVVLLPADATEGNVQVFKNFVSQALAAATGVAPQSVTVTISSWGLTVVFVFFVDSASAAASGIAAANLRANISTWSQSPPSTLSVSLRDAVFSSFGKTALLPQFSPNCGFATSAVPLWTTPSPGDTGMYSVVCDTTFSVVLSYGNQLTGASLNAKVCSALGWTNCSKILLLGIGTAAGIFQGNLQFIDVDPSDAIVQLMQRATQPSQLTTLDVQGVTINGVVAFTTTSATESTSRKGTGSECLGQMWWLVFFLLLIPMCALMIKHAYQRGRRKGIQQVKDKQAQDVADSAMQQQQLQQQAQQQQFYYPQGTDAQQYAYANQVQAQNIPVQASLRSGSSRN